MGRHFPWLSTWIVIVLLLSGCGGEGGSDSASEAGTSIQTDPTDPTDTTTPQSFTTTPQSFDNLGLLQVSEEEWNDTAVRKVLHTFAYGGHATDQQITDWADMQPEQAIVEMLTFDEHNLKLSPVTASNYDGLDKRDGTLRGLGEFWSSDDPQNGVPEEERDLYRPNTSGVEKIWVLAATSRGLNPFRQKIGLWETNYHMVANLDSPVKTTQLNGYYDSLMEALEDDKPYQDVMAIAATSSAIATQYGHAQNRFRNGECFCNEDFAREYYQLFFGVLGEYDPDYHEIVTIKSTSRAFTGISIELDLDGERTDQVTFGTEFHYPGILEMLGYQYGGQNMLERVDQLSQDAINHYESLNNLPVKIISGLADDNLNETKIAQIRSAWSSMQPKSLLSFLRAYAISTLFHSEDRIKYLTSIDRHMLLVNKIGLSNEEGYLNLHGAMDYKKEDVRVFRPVHSVFGGQTGLEASSSAGVFRENFNRVTDAYSQYRKADSVKYGRSWERNWASVVPVDESGLYTVRHVAEWLWNRLMGDGLKNFGSLERAHVYAFLANDQDLVSLASPEDLGSIITSMELETEAALMDLIDILANQTLALNSSGPDERRGANARIGQAINFIAGTPYIFVQEGK